MGSLKQNLEDITLLDILGTVISNIWNICARLSIRGGGIPPINEEVHPLPHRHFPPLSDQIFPMGFACVSWMTNTVVLTTFHIIIFFSSVSLQIFFSVAIYYNGKAAWIQYLFLARACGVPVGRRSGGRLVMTLVATINVIILFLFSFLFFFFLFSVIYFSQGVLGSKNLFCESCLECPKTQR